MNLTSFFSRYKKVIILGFVAVAAMTSIALAALVFAFVKVGSWVAQEFKGSLNPVVLEKPLSMDTSTVTDRLLAVGHVGAQRWLSSHLMSQNYMALSSGFRCLEYLGGPTKSEMLSRLNLNIENLALQKEFNTYLEKEAEENGQPAVANDCVNAVFYGI